MDQERPRTDLSINSRNNLRKVLHLEFLYRENKVRVLLACDAVFWDPVWPSRCAHGPANPSDTGSWRGAAPAVREKPA